MAKYLDKFLSTIPQSLRNKIGALLTDYVDNQRIISVGEYSDWYRNIIHTLDKRFTPSTREVDVGDEDIIASDLLNLMFESIGFDLNLTFEEANALFNFVYLNKKKHTRMLGDLKSQVSRVLAEYNNMQALRQHGSSWSNGVYIHFDAGNSLFLPYGFQLKDNLYIDYDDQTIEPMVTTFDADDKRNTGKLILGGQTKQIALNEPELMEDELSTPPDYTIRTGTNIKNIIDNDDQSSWVEIMCFDSPVLPTKAGGVTAEFIPTENRSTGFEGDILVRGTNNLGRQRSYYLKFITKGAIGTAKYVCSDDSEHYTDLVCKYDTGVQCEFEYDNFYTTECKNKNCQRYTQTGCIQTVYTTDLDTGFTPVYNSHNEDTGLSVKFNGNGTFYPGDIVKITCECEETYGASIGLTLRSGCNSPANHLIIKPLLNYPCIIDSIHYWDEKGNEDIPLTRGPLYLDAPLRLDFEPRVISRLIIRLRQENYINEQYNFTQSSFDYNLMVKEIMEQNVDGITDETLKALIYDHFRNTYLRDMVVSEPDNTIVSRDTFCYVFGLSEITLGHTDYNTVGRSIIKSVETNGLGAARLNIKLSTLKDITYNNNEIGQWVSTPSQTTLGQEQLTSPALTSVEFSLFIKHYNDSGGWIGSLEVPIFPHIYNPYISTDVGKVQREHLRIEDGIGKLRFHSEEVVSVYSVYNDEYLTENQYTVIQQDSVILYETYIDISDYITKQEKGSTALFVVTYYPKTGTFLDKGKTVYIDREYNLMFNLNDEVVKSDVYLLTTGRRNTPAMGITPKLERVHLMLGEIDEYKYYPEGRNDEEFGEILFRDTTIVK